MKRQIDTSVNCRKKVKNSEIGGSTVEVSKNSTITDFNASTNIEGELIDSKATGTQFKEIPDNPKIQELLDRLEQLELAISNTSELSENDKVQALEQVNALAEAGKNPKDSKMQQEAKKAMRFLKGLLAELPTVTNLVKQCNQLLPAIAPFFGL